MKLRKYVTQHTLYGHQSSVINWVVSITKGAEVSTCGCYITRNWVFAKWALINMCVLIRRATLNNKAIKLYNVKIWNYIVKIWRPRFVYCFCKSMNEEDCQANILSQGKLLIRLYMISVGNT